MSSSVEPDDPFHVRYIPADRVPPRHTAMHVATVDYHAAGEPFRIVTGGVPRLGGASVADRRELAPTVLEDYRRLLCSEPRGHAGMYGGFVVDPDDDGADLGVVFFHKDGYSTACGHGTIALATWAIESGLIPRTVDDGEQVVRIDVPSGRVRARARLSGGKVGRVEFANVPSYVSATDVLVPAAGSRHRVGVAFGGAFYASLPLPSESKDPSDLLALADAVRRHPDLASAARHPEDHRLDGIYGVTFFEPLSVTGTGAAQRSTTVFADGAVDRSPCGSGTSARLALLYDEGALGLGETLEHTGPSGIPFTGRIVRADPRGGSVLLATEIGGCAHPTGYHHFVLDAGDAVGLGFQIR